MNNTLLSVFTSLLEGDEVGVSDVDLDNKEQLQEFLDYVFKDKKLNRLAIFEKIPKENLRELLRSSDYNVKLSAAYTIMSQKFPTLNLVLYV